MGKLFTLPTLAALLLVSACSYYGSPYDDYYDRRYHDRKHHNKGSSYHNSSYHNKNQSPPKKLNREGERYEKNDRPFQKNTQDKPSIGNKDRFQRTFRAN